MTKDSEKMDSVGMGTEFRGIECKTFDKKSGATVNLSSYLGWRGSEKYPKLLIIAKLNKNKSKHKILKRHWDLSADVEEITHVKYIPDNSHIVDHDPTLYGRTIRTRADEEGFQGIREEIEDANRNSKKPIKLFYPGFQLRTKKMRLYLKIRKGDLDLLEDAPQEIKNYLEEKLVGSKLSLIKDYGDRGPSGTYDQSMIEWEEENGYFVSPLRKERALGRLLIEFNDGVEHSLPEAEGEVWKHGRKMYWTGEGFEEIVNHYLNIDLTSHHMPGIDFGDGNLHQIRTLIPNISPEMFDVEDDRIGILKVEILGAILQNLGLSLKDNYWSTGSTVTLDGLLAVHGGLQGQSSEEKTKEGTLKAILELVGEEYDSETDFVENGSTVTRYALMKILRGIENLS